MEALRLTRESSWVRVVMFEGRFEAVVRFGGRAWIELRDAILVRGYGYAAGL